MTEEFNRPAAVFLSYASEDADAAARICEALRVADIEVWFDRSELRGGDAWDSQIKKQIHDCALFVPLISAHTNARVEGYFRGEWNLATRRLVNRAHDAAFLMPVVIDETREADARVPEEFLRAQWTRLPGGETPLAFARRVRQLLGIDVPPVPTAKPTPTGVVESGARSPGSVRPRRTSLLRRYAPPFIALLLLVGGGLYWYYRSASEEPVAKPVPSAELAVIPVPPNDKSIAVLPFVDMSAEKNQEYMSDGIAEELLNLLAQAPDLKVIARTSSFSFKGQNIEVSEIAKRLNVAHVLEGSVRTSGKQMRITAQLVRAADSTHLWSEHYDRPIDDIFAVQDDIANAIVSELKGKLLGSAPKARATNPEAYALFLHARDVGRQYTPSAFEQAITLYRQVLELDAGYVAAWQGLATMYCYQMNEGLLLPDEGSRLAREAIQEALALDPQYALAHARLGWIAVFYDSDLKIAAQRIERALALDPSNAEILGIAAILLRRLGRLDQAIKLGKHLVALDPINIDPRVDLGLAYQFAGDLDAALSEFRTNLAVNPLYLGGHGYVADVLLRKGDAKAALTEIRSEMNDFWRLHIESLAFHALGRSKESDAALAEFVDKYGDLSPIFVGITAAYRGENDRAFQWLEKAAQFRDPTLSAIASEPMWGNVRKDPRWLPFLRKINMAPEQLAVIKFDVKLPVEAVAQ